MSVVTESLYAVAFAVIRVIINKIGKFPILCKCNFSHSTHASVRSANAVVVAVLIICFISSQCTLCLCTKFSFQNNSNNNSVLSVYLYNLVTILAVGGAGGIATMFVNIPLAQICLLIIFSCSGIGGNVVNSATVELFPTAMRYVSSFYSRIRETSSLLWRFGTECT